MQAKYVLNQIQKYRGKVFVNNGIDPETGAYPLQANVSSFLAHTRSVLQYAYKECKERGALSAYESAVIRHPIIGVFRELRNTDIHEMVVGTHTVISFESKLFETEEQAKMHREENPAQPTIVNYISKPIPVTAGVIEQFRNEGRTDLADAANEGKALYQAIDFEGEKDLHVLCESYIDSLSEFINDLSQQGAIS